MGQVRAQAGSVLVSVVGTGCALCRLGGGAGSGANVTDVQSAGAGGMRAYDDEPGASRPLPLSPASLAPVRQCLDKITAASTTPELDPQDLRAALIDLLEKVEPNPSIDATVDNLSQAASAYLEEVERAARYADQGRGSRSRKKTRQA